MESTTESPSRAVEMLYGHFITLVAKDRVVKTFGIPVKDWPENNFWALISSYREKIEFKDITTLMNQYGISELHEVPAHLMENQNEISN
jgi:hypothetical protein